MATIPILFHYIQIWSSEKSLYKKKKKSLLQDVNNLLSNASPSFHTTWEQEILCFPVKYKRKIKGVM